MRTKITAAYVIGDAGDGSGTAVYRNGELLYDADRIVAVGSHVEGPWDRQIDLGDVLVSPGFIDCNALGDIDHALFYCEQDHIEKLYWSRRYLEHGPVEAMTAEEEAFKSLYAYVQLIRHGITTAMPITSVYYKRAAETYEEIAAAAEHAGTLGLRVYLGPSYVSAMHVIDDDGTQTIARLGDEGERGLARAERFALEHASDPDDLVHPVMVPERVELQDEDVLTETKRFASEHGLLVRLHAAQGGFEYRTIMAKHGCSTIRYLDSLDFLDDRTLIPHAIYTSGYHGIKDSSDDDLDVLRDRGTHVIHCPLVYSRSGQRLESFARFLRHGISMCMGTDTFPPDMFQNIRMGSAMSMSVDGPSPLSQYRAFYEAATVGGARALGRADLGRLAPGCKADFIAIDLDGFDIGTVDDPLKTVCMCAGGHNVVHSVINGRTVMEHGEIPGIDFDELRVKAQRYYDKLRLSAIDRSPYGMANGDGSMNASDFYQTSYPIIG